MSRGALGRLEAASTPDERKTVALEILAGRTDRTLIDAALRAIAAAPLGDTDRPVLRERLSYYLDHKEKDQGCEIREALTRGLVTIGSPEDLDLYLRAIEVREILRGVDVGQKLRAAALIGIVSSDARLAVFHAVRLLQDLPDTSRFSGEPAVTALRVLAQADQRAAIYQLLLAHPLRLVGEVAATALESLGDDFPAPLYRLIAAPYVDADHAVALTGVFAHIIGARAEALYDVLLDVLTRTHDVHLFRYGVLEMAASRNAELTLLLHRLAQNAAARWPAVLIEALRLLPESDPDRTQSLAALGVHD